jgi:hypothetical protein
VSHHLEGFPKKNGENAGLAGVEANAYLHFPGGIASHPLSIYSDRLLHVAIESDGGEADLIGKYWVPKQVFDTVEGIAVE